MLDELEWPRVQKLLEYGPGTGAFTKDILAKMHPGTKFLAIEVNKTFAQLLRTRFPSLRLINDSAANARAICEREGLEHVDAIVCGLPWASFSDKMQDGILDATLDMLKDGGLFCTFAYLQGVILPGGIRVRRKLHRHFTEIKTSRVIWRNAPPAFVYRCVK
jgi:phospholipid N-methyltransferase